MANDKRFVYVLKGIGSEPPFYARRTSKVLARLADHNAGRCVAPMQTLRRE